MSSFNANSRQLHATLQVYSVDAIRFKFFIGTIKGKEGKGSIAFQETIGSVNIYLPKSNLNERNSIISLSPELIRYYGITNTQYQHLVLPILLTETSDISRWLEPYGLDIPPTSVNTRTSVPSAGLPGTGPISLRSGDTHQASRSSPEADSAPVTIAPARNGLHETTSLLSALPDASVPDSCSVPSLYPSNPDPGASASNQAAPHANYKGSWPGKKEIGFQGEKFVTRSPFRLASYS